MKHVEVEADGKASEKVRPYNRKKLLINPQFQLSFLGYVLGIAGFTIALFYGAKVYFFYQARETILGMGIPPEHVAFEMLDQQARVMDLIFAAATVVELSVLAFWGLRMSNRVAGPVYRVTQDLISLAKGAPPRKVKFRNKDYFPELADAYNLQLDSRGKKTDVA